MHIFGQVCDACKQVLLFGNCEELFHVGTFSLVAGNQPKVHAAHGMVVLEMVDCLLLNAGA
jgi:hypothetical protein